MALREITHHALDVAYAPEGLIKTLVDFSDRRPLIWRETSHPEVYRLHSAANEPTSPRACRFRGAANNTTGQSLGSCGCARSTPTWPGPGGRSPTASAVRADATSNATDAGRLSDSAGVFVVDAKRYQGRIEIRNRGWFFRPDDRHYVGRRGCSDLADNMGWQVRAVEAALRRAALDPLPPITPVLCFIDGDWPLIAAPGAFRGVPLRPSPSPAGRVWTGSRRRPRPGSPSRARYARRTPR